MIREGDLEYLASMGEYALLCFQLLLRYLNIYFQKDGLDSRMIKRSPAKEDSFGFTAPQIFNLGRSLG